MKSQKLLAAAWLLVCTSVFAGNAPKVTIDSGTLAGSVANGVNVFKGVPFAKPPVANLRWQPPQSPDAWTGERDATQFQSPCVQPTNPDGKTPNGGGVWGKTSPTERPTRIYSVPSHREGPFTFSNVRHY
jgi:para-nitrobenzyl esterase